MRYGVICFLVFCCIIRPPGTTAMPRQKRLAGGNLITDNRYPWVVSISKFYTNDENKATPRQWCTGSIIDIYGTVITAAHCVGETKQILGETYKLQNVAIRWGSFVSRNNTRRVRVRLSNIVRHPRSYSVHQKPDEEDIDIALIFLKKFRRRPINCRDPTVMPVLLSTTGGKSAPTNGIVAGFGKQPKTNQNNTITGYTDGQLSELKFNYGGRGKRTRNRTIYYNASVQSSSMFYGYPHPTLGIPFNLTTRINYTGLCQGDSGGPYMENEDGKIRLRGIVQGHQFPRNETSPCSREGRRNNFMDINYPEIRNWVIGALVARYNETGVGILGDIPRVCT